MASTTARTALGLGALFLGGLLGGLLGSVFLRGATTPAGVTQRGEAVARDDGLRAAIEALTSEVRRLGVATPTSGTERAPVTDGTQDSAARAEFGDVVVAIERLTQALSLAQGHITPGGIGISPLVVPPLGSRSTAIDQLEGRDWEDLSREYRFMTYQQVLDRFGRPDEVSDSSWLYRPAGGEGGRAYTFRFLDGYLMNVYP